MQRDAMSTPLRDASLSPSPAAPPPIPGTVVVRRLDNNRSWTVTQSAIRYAAPGPYKTVNYGMTDPFPSEGRQEPCVRCNPDSRFCARVEILAGGGA